MLSIEKRIAGELAVSEPQVQAAVQLLDQGSTVPFIARYRKEATGALDDTQLRTLEERLAYLRELDDRRVAIKKSIEEQGKLTPELAKAIEGADTKTRLEDIYLPYKKKRRTKGQVAIEAGIEPLADALFANPALEPQKEASSYINKDESFKGAYDDEKGVLEGARAILVERFAEDSDLVGRMRLFLLEHGVLISTVIQGKEQEGAKFRDYFDKRDKITRIPSHRALAMFRGRNEGFLALRLDVEHDEQMSHPCESMVAVHFGLEKQGRAADAFLFEVVRHTWRVKLQLKLETELLSDLRQAAESEAISVFAHNLKDLLLASPAGQKATIGLDPGLRTGVKVAVVDSTGQLLDHTNIYPHEPQRRWDEAIDVLAKLASKHQVSLLAIGNGTASRETDSLCGALVKRHPELGLQKVMVSEAGASVYSASKLAAKEFPNLDVTIRGAVSIARRLQDPLAELVKIEPKSIGVGQYQHDVSQVQLAKKLDAVVEDCVNLVGVEVNTASAALLCRVSGLNQTIADNIVEERNKKGPFADRKQLLKVPRLGEKTFEQAAGFLRIHGGQNPLDASAVHPESYSLVGRIAAKTNKTISDLIGNTGLLKTIEPKGFVDEKFGLPTIQDILSELDKPGRDPRPAFKTATFKEGVETITDLKPNMLLEGIVTNVTNFGAFVDIGVHQDGLVHISMMAQRFVRDPHDVVKAGDVVKVRVLEVDLERKRIALTMRLEERVDSASGGASGAGAQRTDRSKPASKGQSQRSASSNSDSSSGHQKGKGPMNNALAIALAKSQSKGKSRN